MSTGAEKGWPALLSFAGHELRNPLGVIAGYVNMLLRERAGPLTDMQRWMLKESEKSCARLKDVLDEISKLASMEGGKTTFKSSTLDLRSVLSDAIASVPADAEYPGEIVLDSAEGNTEMVGDAPRLKAAFTAMLWALRRELTGAPQLLVRYREAEFRGKPAQWIAIGEPQRIDELQSASAEMLTDFNEHRGGCGLSLALARRVITGHGGALWSPGQGTKAGAVVALPRSS